jgi:hypothetical protein
MTGVEQGEKSVLLTIGIAEHNWNIRDQLFHKPEIRPPTPTKSLSLLSPMPFFSHKGLAHPGVLA